MDELKDKASSLKDKVLSMRLNEFGLAKTTYLFEPDKDDFPNKIDVVKWVETDSRKIYSISEEKYIMSTQYCFVIAELNWDEREDDWDFISIGTRYLEYGTDELNKWILDFCNNYKVYDGELIYRGKSKDEK